MPERSITQGGFSRPFLSWGRRSVPPATTLASPPRSPRVFRQSSTLRGKASSNRRTWIPPRTEWRRLYRLPARWRRYYAGESIVNRRPVVERWWAIVVTKERFAQGLTLDQYVDQMTVNQELFRSALDRVALGSAEAQILDRLGRPRKVLVITEDWCGTSLLHVPFVARLVEVDPDIEMRIVLRDANPDLMDQYLKNGRYRSVPVFVFFDAEMNELARFIEQRPR